MASLVREVKKLYPSIEVILLTGYSLQDDIPPNQYHGAFDCISKPYDIDVISETAKKAIQKKNKNLSET